MQQLFNILFCAIQGENESPKPRRRHVVTNNEGWESSEKSDMSDIINSDSLSAKMFESEDNFYVSGNSDNNLF